MPDDWAGPIDGNRAHPGALASVRRELTAAVVSHADRLREGGGIMAGGLLTDLYELNMAASYLRRGMTGLATFSLFVRQLPADRGFLVAAGLSWSLTRAGR